MTIVDGSLARGAAILAAVACCAPSAALAQGRAGFRPVFGGAAPVDVNAPMAVNLTLSLAEAYDQDLIADAGAAPTPGVQASGLYASLSPVANLTGHGRRIGYSLDGSTNLRRYELGSVAMMNYNLGGGLSANLGRATSVVVNQTVSYTPSYLYALFGDATSTSTPTPGQPITGAPDYKTSSFQSYTYGTTAALTHALSPRTSFSVDGAVRRTNFVGNVGGIGDTDWGTVGAHYRYRLNRAVVVNVGYSQWDLSNQLFRTVEHDLQSGLEFTRFRSATRRTTFGFNVGPVRSQMGAPSADRWQMQGSHYRVVGDGFFEHEIGRTWSAHAAYRRALTYVEGLTTPVYADNASVSTSGFVSRRADLWFSGGYVTGEMAAPTVTAARFTTYTAAGRVRFGLSRNLAAYVEGLFYDYAFDPRLLLPGLPPQYTRAGVRAGVTVWSGTSEHRAAR